MAALLNDVPTDLALPVRSAPMTRWDKRRAFAGQVLELSAQLVAPLGGPDRSAGPRGRIQRGLDLVSHLLPKSIESHRSLWSSHSMYSAISVVSFGSIGSVLSAFSMGSMLSIGSTGSILSIGSAGSVLSIGSAGSVLSIGGLGERRLPGSALAMSDGGAPTLSLRDPATRAIQLAATSLGAAAVGAAVIRR